MRKAIISLLGIAILVGALFWYRSITSQEKPRRPNRVQSVVPVYTQTVSNSEIPISVEVRGRVEPTRKMEIFSEVQGIFQSDRSFRPATRYAKGETLVYIDDTRERANLKAQRANLLNLVVQILPDIKFDFPEEYDKWQSYVTDFDIEQKTRSLPEPASDREKFFVSSRDLANTYYSIKVSEAQLEKHRIVAPFAGVLTEAFVTPGALVRAGQPLGTLSSLGGFEVVLSIPEQYADGIEIGKKVTLVSQDNGRQIQGQIQRVNPTINAASQTIQVYVRVADSDLREGMFFVTDMDLKPISDVMRIDRKLLVENKYVYGVEDSVLVSQEVVPMHYEQETVVVRGLCDSSQILQKMVPSAREGMKVQVVQQ